MTRKFDSGAFYKMSDIKTEIEEKLKQSKGNEKLEKIYKEQLRIVYRCINSLYI